MKIPSVSRNIPFLFPLFCFKCSGTSPKGPTYLLLRRPHSARGPQRGPRDPESSHRAGRPGGSRCAFETARGSHFEQGLETKRGAGGLANVASHGDEGPSFSASRTRLAAVTSVSAGSGPGARRLPQALGAAASSSSPGGVPGAPPSAPLVLRRGIYTRVL